MIAVTIKKREREKHIAATFVIEELVQLPTCKKANDSTVSIKKTEVKPVTKVFCSEEFATPLCSFKPKFMTCKVNPMQNHKLRQRTLD